MDSGFPESVCGTAPEYNRLARFSVLGEALNADGGNLGELLAIRVETVSVFAKVFKNVTGGLSDWQMPSSDPFNGIVGLDFSPDGRMTLDDRSRKIGITAATLLKKFDHKRCLFVDHIKPSAEEGFFLQFL